MDHDITIERHGPQRFVPRCACGWIGKNVRGNDPWSKPQALGPALKHQTDNGLPMSMPNYIDLEPRTKRGRK